MGGINKGVVGEDQDGAQNWTNLNYLNDGIKSQRSF